MISKVSIILPTHNGMKFLRGAIDSCLAQTHRNIELILVDDRSTDATPEIMESYKDPRVRVIRNRTNQRLPRSLNIGFKEATGEYLTWTSDDNEYSPDAIEKMLQALRKEPTVDFVYADYWALDETTGKKELVRAPDTLRLDVKNEVGGCFLYSRKVYEMLGGYNPYYEMVEDHDYWIRVWKRFSARRCPGPLYLYRYHEQSLTTTRHFNQDLFDIILKFRNGYAPLSKLGWTAAYYFDNMKRSGKSEEEKQRLIRHTRETVAGLSRPFYVLFSLLAFLYSFRVKK